jgi:4a-hydroxytetrahydrobiopterin dehydratase
MKGLAVVLLLTGLLSLPLPAAGAEAERTPLTAAEAEAALEELPAWQLDADHRLSREVRFGSYPGMVGFLVRSAFVFEAENHHPDARFAYRGGQLVLTLKLGTHDAGGVATPLDVRVAHRVEALIPAAQP